MILPARDDEYVFRAPFNFAIPDDRLSLAFRNNEDGLISRAIRDGTKTFRQELKGLARSSETHGYP